MTAPDDVLTVWREAGRDRWFARDDSFDRTIRERFTSLWEAARDGKLAQWENSDAGMLALIIVLDQFPRNIFRDDARAFSTDELARNLAERAIARGVDQRTEEGLRSFIYIPFMHSENIGDQARCVALFENHPDPENLRYAKIHEDVIHRFGRFPHRNSVLGRTTTEEEDIFLKSGGFSG